MVFSDDPLASRDMTPRLHDELKFKDGNTQAKIYRSIEPLERISSVEPPNQPKSHQPKRMTEISSASGPAQRDSSWIAASPWSCVKAQLPLGRTVSGGAAKIGSGRGFE
jgi:hypothetical protein